MKKIFNGGCVQSNSQCMTQTVAKYCVTETLHFLCGEMQYGSMEAWYIAEIQSSVSLSLQLLICLCMA
jgi:hypothetical protein